VSSGNPFSIGFRAARANLIPGLVIQALMAGVVIAYYWLPEARSWFGMLAVAKARGGFAFSSASAVLAGAVLPMLFKIALQRGRVRAGDVQELLFLAVFWGVDGVILDAFYRLQAMLFGAHADFATVMKKVAVDQFIYNPVFAGPYTAICYELRQQGFRLRRIGHAFTAPFYRERTIPLLCATWTVWIPVTCAIYALPSLLQIPLFALALTFWVLMLAYITTAHLHGPPPAPAPLPQPVGE